jgi:hypothetical protein
LDIVAMEYHSMASTSQVSSGSFVFDLMAPDGHQLGDGVNARDAVGSAGGCAVEAGCAWRGEVGVVRASLNGSR